jgi:hypothetical protein
VHYQQDMGRVCDAGMINIISGQDHHRNDSGLVNGSSAENLGTPPTLATAAKHPAGDPVRVSDFVVGATEEYGMSHR